ncbi:MAG TPA: GNAT family N-acetyltransferase [Drouetiella sp.]
MITLETDRLLFRRIDELDLNELSALYADPDVMKYYPRTRSKDETRDAIKSYQKRYAEDGISLMAAVRKADNKLIGRCGIILQVIDNEVFPEVGYMFDKSVWREGLGTEAAKAFLDYGFEQLSYPEMICIIHPLNLASQKVAQKIGMQLRRYAIYDNVECQIYSILRSTWLSLIDSRN